MAAVNDPILCQVATENPVSVREDTSSSMGPGLLFLSDPDAGGGETVTVTVVAGLGDVTLTGAGVVASTAPDGRLTATATATGLPVRFLLLF